MGANVTQNYYGNGEVWSNTLTVWCNTTMFASTALYQYFLSNLFSEKLLFVYLTSCVAFVSSSLIEQQFWN